MFLSPDTNECLLNTEISHSDINITGSERANSLAAMERIGIAVH